MTYSKQQLQKFADLVRIEISDKELESMDINSIIDWFEKLQKINTVGVEPMLSPVNCASPLRADIITEKNIRINLLNGAPDKTGESRGYFAVPKVMEE